MFRKRLLQRIDALEDTLEKKETAIIELNRNLRDLEHKKKLAEEDIAHMVRIKEERLEVAFEKRCANYERECDKRVASNKDEYRDKQEAYLNKQIEGTNDLMEKILARLPDVSAHLKGKI